MSEEAEPTSVSSQTRRDLIDSFSDLLVEARTPACMVEAALEFLGIDATVSQAVLTASAEAWFGLIREEEMMRLVESGQLSNPRSTDRREHLVGRFREGRLPERIMREVATRLTNDPDADRLLLIDAAIVILSEHTRRDTLDGAIRFWSERPRRGGP